MTSKNPPKHIPQLFTTDEVAELFKVSKSTIYRMTQSGMLQFYKIGGGMRFIESDMLAFLEKDLVNIHSEDYEEWNNECTEEWINILNTERQYYTLIDVL